MTSQASRGIARAGERYGRYRIAAMLRGETEGLPAALATLSTTGSLRHEPTDSIRAWIDAAIAAGLVVVSKDQYRTLRLTDRGRAAEKGDIQNVEFRRPLTRSYASALGRYRDRRPARLDSATMFGRRRWSGDLDPFEFDPEFSRGFDEADD